MPNVCGVCVCMSASGTQSWAWYAWRSVRVDTHYVQRLDPIVWRVVTKIGVCATQKLRKMSTTFYDWSMYVTYIQVKHINNFINSNNWIGGVLTFTFINPIPIQKVFLNSKIFIVIMIIQYILHFWFWFILPVVLVDHFPSHVANVRNFAPNLIEIKVFSRLYLYVKNRDGISRSVSHKQCTDLLFLRCLLCWSRGCGTTACSTPHFVRKTKLVRFNYCFSVLKRNWAKEREG